MQINPQTSARIYNLSFFATLAVMFMHLPDAGVVPGRLYSFFDSFTVLAVPTFFLLSGFLLGRSASEPGWYARALKKRATSLVVPYFVLNTLMIPFLVLHQNILKAGNWAPGGVQFDWYSISRIYGLTFRYTPVVGALWYVRCLLFFILLSPLLIRPLRRTRTSAVLVLTLVFAGVAALEGAHLGDPWGYLFYYFFNLRGFCFFTLGLSCAFWAPAAWPAAWRPYTLGVCAAAGLSLWLLAPACRSALPLWLVMLAAIWLATPSRPLPRFLTASSFALFGLHQLVYHAHAAGIRLFKFQELFTASPLVLTPLVASLVLILPFAQFARTKAPRLDRLLFGGRCGGKRGTQDSGLRTAAAPQS